jgi:hypothetical protein
MNRFYGVKLERCEKCELLKQAMASHQKTCECKEEEE